MPKMVSMPDKCCNLPYTLLRQHEVNDQHAKAVNKQLETLRSAENPNYSLEALSEKSGITVSRFFLRCQGIRYQFC